MDRWRTESGLEWSKRPDPSHIEPTQYPTSLVGMAKTQTIRTKGLEAKYTRGDDLMVFAKDLKDWVVDHGMDTVTYAPDPADKSKVVSVLKEYGRFEVKAGSKIRNDLLKNKHDRYSLQNDKDAKKFLLNSVDADTKRQLYESCTEDDSFIAYFLHLVDACTSVSAERFDKSSLTI